MRRRKLPRLPKRVVELVEDLRREEDRLALVLSLVIGALVGLVVVAFILLTGRLAAHMYPAGGSGWRRILVPTLGSLVTGYLLFRYFPLARGSGIPQTRAAVFIHDGRISLRSVVGKFICCSTSLASGIALGREGPAVYIGSGLASVIARRLGLSKSQVKWLLPVGGAAALSAAFNTPIAAVLFTLEEIMGDLHAPVLGSGVLASATAWIVLHLLLGDSPLFHVAGYKLVNPAELGIYVVLWLVGGFAFVAVVKLLLFFRGGFLRMAKSDFLLQPVAGGVSGKISPTPLNTVIMIFELTRYYTIIVPLMISTLIAFFIPQKFQREPIYEALAHQDGMHLPSGPFRAATALWVTSAIRTPPQPLTLEMKVDEAVELIDSSDLESRPVADDDRVVGMG